MRLKNFIQKLEQHKNCVLVYQSCISFIRLACLRQKDHAEFQINRKCSYIQNRKEKKILRITLFGIQCIALFVGFVFISFFSFFVYYIFFFQRYYYNFFFFAPARRVFFPLKHKNRNKNL